MGLYSNTLTLTSPSPLVVSNNPIVVGLSTGSVTTPTNATGKIKVLSNTTVNTTVTFNLTGFTSYNKTFTSKEYPNKDEYFVCDLLKDENGNVIAGANYSTSEIASSLAECIQKDIVINSNYFINYSGGSIIEIVARSSGSIYNLNGRVTTSNPAKITFTNVIAGANQFQGSSIPDYSLWVDIYKGDDSQEYLKTGDLYPDSIWKKVSELSLPFSSDNVHRFDCSQVINGYLSTPFPNFNQSGFTTFANSISKPMLPFKFAYGESYGVSKNESTIKRFQKGMTGVVWAVNGALDYNQANQLINYTGATTGDIYSKFLTNSPVEKQSTRSGRELLYFIVPKNIRQPMTLHCDLLYWDGNVETNRRLLVLFSGSNYNLIDNYGGIHIINVSHEYLLKPIENVNGKIKKATFYLRYGTIFKWSESKTFTFPYSAYDNTYPIAFLNKKGMFDTFDFLGNQEQSIDRTKSDLTLPLSFNANGSLSTGFKNLASYDVKAVDKIIVNTGFIDQIHFDWLSELIESNEIYNYSTGDYLRLEGYKYSRSTTTNDFNIECTFVKTIANNNVSI